MTLLTPGTEFVDTLASSQATSSFWTVVPLQVVWKAGSLKGEGEDVGGGEQIVKW